VDVSPVYKHQIPRLQHVGLSLYHVSDIPTVKGYDFIKIVIMQPHFPRGIIPQAEQSEGLLQIACLFIALHNFPHSLVSVCHVCALFARNRAVFILSMLENDCYSRDTKEVKRMELIFKKYHKAEHNQERNYLIYDPSRNQAQFTGDLYRAIAHRNFVQGCERILIGPILQDKKMTVRVLNADGTEVSLCPNTKKIFRAYLHDQGYPSPGEEESPDGLGKGLGDVHEFGTVYYFPA